MDHLTAVSNRALLSSRHFLPLFITQFLGAFNDNLYKLAMLTLIIYRLADQSPMDEASLANIAAGLFMLPFFLASALAGQLADKFEKSVQIRLIKLWEVILMCVGAYGFFTSNITLMMVILFGMGLQSTFFGPIKYAILPQHLKQEQLLAANSLIEAGTFLAILLGTLLGGPLIMAENGLYWATGATIGFALIGFCAALFIPKTPRAAPDIRLRKNFIAETRTQFKEIKKSKPIFLSVIGISWFWMFGSVFLAQISPLAKNILRVNEYGMTAILALFTIGVGVGSLLCNRLLKGRISAQYQKRSLSIIGVSGVILYTLLALYPHHTALPDAGHYLSVWDFLATPIVWFIALSIIGLSIGGGMFIVPLYARLQQQSNPDRVSRTIAANNVMNSIFMVMGAVFALGIIQIGIQLSMPLGVSEILLIVSLLNLAFIYWLAPLERSENQTKD